MVSSIFSNLTLQIICSENLMFLVFQLRKKCVSLTFFHLSVQLMWFRYPFPSCSLSLTVVWVYKSFHKQNRNTNSQVAFVMFCYLITLVITRQSACLCSITKLSFILWHCWSQANPSTNLPLLSSPSLSEYDKRAVPHAKCKIGFSLCKSGANYTQIASINWMHVNLELNIYQRHVVSVREAPFMFRGATFWFLLIRGESMWDLPSN